MRQNRKKSSSLRSEGRLLALPRQVSRTGRTRRIQNCQPGEIIARETPVACQKTVRSHQRVSRYEEVRDEPCPRSTPLPIAAPRFSSHLSASGIGRIESNSQCRHRSLELLLRRKVGSGFGPHDITRHENALGQCLQEGLPRALQVARRFRENVQQDARINGASHGVGRRGDSRLFLASFRFPSPRPWAEGYR